MKSLRRMIVILFSMVLIPGLVTAGPPAAAVGDMDAPVVSAVTVLPSSVPAGEWVEVTWRLTDASGVQGTSAIVSGPNGSTLMGCSLGSVQVSGTTKDGLWSLICQIPATSAVGTYRVQIHASDVAGNSRSLPMDQSDATFTVTSGGGGDADVDAPAVSAVGVLPSSVPAGEWVEVTWRLTDASGVQGTSAIVSGPTGLPSMGCSLGACRSPGRPRTVRGR